MISEMMNNVKSMRPLIHNITNYVAATDCANITLAIGASPIMADEPNEAYEVASLADALVLNTGTISQSRLYAMLSAGKAANEKGIPIILDPVGAGISTYRTNVVNSVISQLKPCVIRMNASELTSICLSKKNLSGVDSGNISDTKSIASMASQLAKKTSAVICVSGETDVVSDGCRIAVIKSGHEMMRKITGTGCMLSSVIGALAAANKNDIFSSAVSALAIYGHCAKKAYRNGIGIASYKNNFFDEIYNLNTEVFKIEYR